MSEKNIKTFTVRQLPRLRCAMHVPLVLPPAFDLAYCTISRLNTKSRSPVHDPWSVSWRFAPICARPWTIFDARHVSASDNWGLTMSFRDWQPRYAARGIATIPVGPDKCPLMSRRNRVGVRGSSEIAPKFSDAECIASVAGPRAPVNGQCEVASVPSLPL
jgi:hypothetical protein